MAYWGSGITENDASFNQMMSVVVYLRKEMNQVGKCIAEEGIPEQSILPLIKCVRVLKKEFPSDTTSTFGQQQFLKAKQAFYQWYEKNKNKTPLEYREEILKEAEEEFAKW